VVLDDEVGVAAASYVTGRRSGGEGKNVPSGVGDEPVSAVDGCRGRMDGGGRMWCE